MSVSPSARLEKLRWPEMIVKLRKEQKYSEILKQIVNFNKILQELNILKNSKPSNCLKNLSSIPISNFKIIVSLVHKDP